jgi:1,2-diacylglycerol 3-alpha-glucosyltransferase
MEQKEVHLILKQGEDYFAENELDNAKICFKKILEADPNHTEALNNIGVIAFQQGNYDQASPYFYRALEINNGYVEAIENLVKCLMAKGALLEAADAIKKAYELSVVTTDLLNTMAQLFIHLGDVPAAKQVLNESLRMDANQEDVSTLLGELEKASTSQRLESIHFGKKKRINIGFITLWYERGQAYVTRMLRAAIAQRHETFILARNGGTPESPLLSTAGEWAVPNLSTFNDYKIPYDRLRGWILENRLDVIFFNEEYDFGLVETANKCGVKTIGYYVWELFNPDWSQAVRSMYDVVICPTQCSYHKLRELGIDNSVYLKWGVDTDLFHPTEQVKGGPVRFFHPAGWGGLHSRRGTGYVIDAFRKANLPDAELLIHTQQGSGKEQDGNITILHGTVSRSELIRMYQESEIAVLPSKWEGLGLTFLEAIGCGLPIITVDAPPMNEFVRNGETGFLCRVAERQSYPGIFVEGLHVDIVEMAEKMRMMMADRRRFAMREKTKEFGSEFSIQKFNESLIDLIVDSTKHSSQDVRLNLGCGSDIRDGYINIDQRKMDGVDLIADVSNLPYPEASVSEILANDVIEHFPRGRTEDVLSEWVRILGLCGTLKLQCPDVRALSYAIVSNQFPVKEFSRRIYGGQDYAGNFHYAGFDIPEMKRMLRKLGMWPQQVSAYNGNFAITANRKPQFNTKKLRIILISARFTNYPWGTGNFIHKALVELGHEVIDIDFRRDCDRVGELLQEPADLVIAYKGSGINPRLLEMMSCPTILWYPDDVLTVQHAENDLRNSGYAYDHVYYFDQAGLERLRQMGISHSSFLPPATDPTVYSYIPGTKKKYDVAFVGTVYQNRRGLLDRLKRKFNVLETKAFMEDMVRIFNEAKIVLNLGVGKSGYPLRVFEALGCKSFLVTNEIDHDHRLFKDGEHLAYFNDNNIEDIISYYLRHDDERESIAMAGYREVCTKHIFQHRVSQMLVDAALVKDISEITREDSLII